MHTGEPAFPEKSHRPDEAALAESLGRARSHWKALIAHSLALEPGATEEWRYYKQSGWHLAINGKRRNLVYLIPRRRCFTMSMALSDAAVQAVEASDLPAEVVKAIVEAKRYPEGRPARVTVMTAADAKIAKKLIELKVEVRS